MHHQHDRFHSFVYQPYLRAILLHLPPECPEKWDFAADGFQTARLVKVKQSPEQSWT
jgi:hypothetical protein